MAATVEMQEKDRFQNVSGATVGVSIRKPGGVGGFKGIPVYPGETIDLDKDEQAVTANAPRDPRSNPLANGVFKLISEGLDFSERRPLRFAADLASQDPANPKPENADPNAGLAPYDEEQSEVGTAVESLPVEQTEGEFAAGEEQDSVILTGRDVARQAPKAAPGQLQGVGTRPKTTST